MSGAMSATTLAALNAGVISVGTAAALPSAAAVLTGASMASSAIGSIQQGQAKAASAKYNAKIAERNAGIARENANYAGAEGESQAGVQGLKNRSQAGAMKAEQGASGVELNTGSSANVQASQTQLGQLDALTIRSNAARRAYGFQTEAASQGAQASVDNATASKDKAAGYIAATSGLLTQKSQGVTSGAISDPFSTHNNKGALNDTTS